MNGLNGADAGLGGGGPVSAAARQGGRPGASGSAARTLLTAVVAAFMLYWAHRVLQLQYHRHCKADLIRVVLFNQSVMCSHIAGVLNLVELACNQAVKQVTAHVLGTLNVVAGGALLGGGLGLFQLPQALF